MNILALAGSCTDPGIAAVMGIVKRILSLIQIVGPILALISFSIHITMLMKNPDDKKRIPKIRNSAIALIVLFLVPAIVNIVFGMLGETSSLSACWNNSDVNIAREVTYQPVEEEKRSTGFIINPGDYERGKPKPSPRNGGGTGTGGENTGGGTGTSTGSGNTGTGGRSSSSTVDSFSGGSLVKQENTSSLKIAIYQSGSYYVTKIWAQNPYQQLNKYDSPNYGSSLVRPGELLSSAVSKNGLDQKAVIGFNASGFYLKNTYDVASVDAYPPYDKTSVGTLVITNGVVVRNAYDHAVKTWYIAGVDQSNRFRIFEDVKSGDAAAKKNWSSSVIGSIRNSFTFASPLVVNGQASDIITSMPSPESGVNRQAFCQIDSNNFALITGSGLTRQDLINIMLSLNCQTGTNFDGGGSIALLYKSKNAQNIETITGNRRALTEVGYFTELG